jgi:hypothetical protein
MKRKVILLFSLVLLTSTTTAQLYDADHTMEIKEAGFTSPSDGKITYTDDISITATCDPDTGRCLATGGGNSLRDIEVSCKQDDVSISISGQYSAGTLVDAEGVRTSTIPGELYCGLGQHEIRLIDPNTGKTLVSKTFEVHSSKNGHPNKGYYIVLRLRNNNAKLEDFFLTNEPWYDKDGGILGFNEFPDLDSGRALPKGALFLGSEADRNLGDKSDEGVWVASYGDIIRPFNSALWDHVSYAYDTGDGSAGWFAGDNGGKTHVENTMKTDFGSLTDGPEIDQKCSVADNNYPWNGNCAPLHQNGDYRPQGEIIVASEPSKSTFADTGDPLSRADTTHFYVCRTDYKGTKPSNSKVVKVQEASRSVMVDNWKYYRCNEANEWQRIECPPGQKVDRESGKLECVNKDPVTVNVKFFDISGVPQRSSGDSIIAGFKIESGEVDKYENFMDEELNQIDAECWMGDDDRYPGTRDTPSSETGKFTLNYQGSGAAWVLGEIPYRTGVKNNTYSCVWGFSDKKASRSPDDYNIKASTRVDPFRSVEGSRAPIDYSTLRSEYSDFRSNELEKGISRDNLWTPYSGGDSRPYVDSTQTDMFGYPNELPYCEQPPYIPADYPNFSDALKDVYENVMCS